MIEKIPSILTGDPQGLKRLIGLAEGKVRKVQIDIVDGEFADNKTVMPEAMGYIETNLDFDFHLMTREPAVWVEKCVRVGALGIIGQIEMMSNQKEFVEKVQEAGIEVGLGVDLPTDVLELDADVLNEVDVVLVMSVPAGFGGQKFDTKALEKIEDLSEVRERDKYAFRICVDGGVNEENLKRIAAAGADEVVIGEERLFKIKNGEN